MSLPAPRVLISAQDIRKRVATIAADISRSGVHDLLVVAVMKGAFVFASDLVRALDVPLSIDFVTVSSYGTGTATSGAPRVLKDLDGPVEGRDVLLVEDVVDSGLTLALLQQHLRTQHPRSLRTACLLDKPRRRQAAVTVDYVGFTIGDEFVVGYGLDHAGHYRNLPYIGVFDG